MKKIVLFTLSVLLVSWAAYKGIEYMENTMTPLALYGEPGHQVPSFTFINQMGESVSSEDISDKIWVVDFFFTSCPTICPKMTRNLQSLHDFVREDEEIRILSFTVDPKRDTPERLKSYAESFRVNHRTWQFFTGEKGDLYKLGNRGFLLSTASTGVDDMDFIHSENIVLVDREQRIRGFYNGTDAKCVQQILRDIKKIKRDKA